MGFDKLTEQEKKFIETQRVWHGRAISEYTIAIAAALVIAWVLIMSSGNQSWQTSVAATLLMLETLYVQIARKSRSNFLSILNKISK